jgi:ketosteroid isomerase-like protein
VVIAEYDYRGIATRTGRSFVASNVQIIRVRDGLIISSRDYHDHSVLAAALHS